VMEAIRRRRRREVLLKRKQKQNAKLLHAHSPRKCLSARSNLSHY